LLKCLQTFVIQVDAKTEPRTPAVAHALKQDFFNTIKRSVSRQFYVDAKIDNTSFPKPLKLFI
jgi:hypothetical protein